MDEDERVSRYKYLLQPIRDLADHLDDDIYEIIGLYLEKLKMDRERTVVSDDGQVLRFNFSEAAVLLQSTFQLFGKKVDRLYDQVFEACSGVSTTKKKGAKRNAQQGAEGEEQDPRQMRKNNFDLDVDVEQLKEAQVSLQWLFDQDKKKEAKLPPKVGQIRTEGQRDRLVDLPISFMPTKKTAPSKHYLRFEQTNDHIYVRQDELFSFSACAYASPSADQMTVFMNVAYKSIMNEFTPELEQLRSQNHDDQDSQPSDAPEDMHVEINSQNVSDEYGQGGMEDGFDEVQPLGDAPSGIAAEETQLVEGVRRTSDHRQTMETRPPTVLEDLSQGCSDTRRTTRLGEPVPGKTWREQIEFMDEFVPLDIKKRPLKASTTHIKRAEQQVEKRNKKIEEQLAAAGMRSEMHSIGAYVTAKIFSHRLLKMDSVLANFNPGLRSRQIQSLNRVLYAQERFESAVLKQRKELQKERDRNQRALQRSQRRSSRRNPNDLPPDERNSLANGTNHNDNFGALPDEDDIVSLASDDSEITAAGALAQAIDDDEDLAGQPADNEDMELDLPVLEDEEEHELVLGDLSRPNPLAELTAEENLLEGESEYAHFIKEHPMLDSLIQDMADKTAHQVFQSVYKYWNKTNSGLINNKGKKQIQEWNQRIAERLVEEERHKPFDIHQYGTEVIDSFGNGESVGRHQGLTDVMRGCERYERSRYLLATLILANNGNVEINTEPVSDSLDLNPTMSNAQLKLVSRKRHHEIFADEQRLITG